MLPRGVRSQKMWDEAQKVAKEADKKVEGRDYRVIEENGKKVAVILVDGKIPKVRQTALWLTYRNYLLSGTEPNAESPFATVCTPYIFNKYRAIFGLSGSVGGAAELHYLASTYGAIKFEVPRFLDTCTGDARKVVTNHGVELVDGEAALIGRVVQVCLKWVRKVPVLVITSGPDELLKVVNAVKECDGIHADEVQRFSQFDAHGRTLKDKWETIIAGTIHPRVARHRGRGAAATPRPWRRRRTAGGAATRPSPHGRVPLSAAADPRPPCLFLLRASHRRDQAPRRQRGQPLPRHRH